MQEPSNRRIQSNLSLTGAVTWRKQRRLEITRKNGYGKWRLVDALEGFETKYIQEDG